MCLWRRMAVALSLVYGWLTVFRPKGSARERVGSHSAAGWKPTGLPLPCCKHPQGSCRGDRSVCASIPPLSTICYPTTEPHRMGPEEGQLGVLQGRKDLKSLSFTCILQDSVRAHNPERAVAILDIRS